MDITAKDISNFLEEIAPVYLEEEWDNTGFLVGDENAVIKGVMVALDITKDVIQQAKNAGANMIVSHHPVIFTQISEVTNTRNSIVYELIKNDINAYCAHTTLDNANGGVNDCLAKALNLMEVKILEEFKDGQGTGRFGKLCKQMNAKELAEYTKIKLNSEYIRYADAGKQIENVAVVGGSGASFIDRAMELGADAIITGDIKHHDALKCLEMGITVVDATHFATEQIAKDRIISHLQTCLNKLQYSIVLVKADEKDIMSILVRE